MAELAILNDVTECTGCRGCQVACKQWNDLPAEKTEFFAGPGYQNPGDLSAKTWNLVKFSEWEENGQADWAFRRRACMHCSEAACVDSCPTGALIQTKEGLVVLKEDNCLGCRVCSHACPYGVPQVDFQTGKVGKCDFCVDRIGKNLEPACVKACSTGALQFGTREEMMARAREIARKDEGVRIYGDTQLGGLHVIYALPGEFERFELPRNPQPGIGFKLVRSLLKPFGLLTGAALLWGWFESKKHGLEADEEPESIEETT